MPVAIRLRDDFNADGRSQRSVTASYDIRRPGLAIWIGRRFATPPTSCRQACKGAFADQLAFELGETDEDAEDQFSRWCGGIDLRSLTG